MIAGETILVVEDDVQMRRFLRASLTSHGFAVAEAPTLLEGRRFVQRGGPSLMLLDLGLPDGDGMNLLRSVRASSRVPVIILSARGREEEKVAALDAGADDYLTKPFGVGELLARVRVALRHAREAAAPPPSEVLTAGPIRVDRARHEVTIAGKLVHLTPIEFQLLSVLVENAGRVLTHRQILRHVWGPTAVEQTHYLRVHMVALRRKVEVDPARPQWLLTESGVGYRLRDPSP